MKMQLGYTLVEIMVNMVVTFILLASVLIAFRDIHARLSLLREELRLNSHARELTGLLIQGHGSSNNIWTNGLEGMSPASPLPNFIWKNYRLFLSTEDEALDYGSNRLVALQLACINVQNPLPDCLNTGDIKTVEGRVATEPVLSTDYSVLSSSNANTRNTIDLSFDIFNGHLVSMAAKGKPTPPLNEYLEHYRTTILPLVD